MKTNLFLLKFAMLGTLALSACAESSGADTPTPNPTPGPSPSSARNLYISPEGSDSNNGLASVFAFRTFDKVLEVLKPGDVVNIMPGVYETDGKPILELTPLHSGEEGKYITFKAYDEKNPPRFVGKGRGVWNTVVIGASYIVFDGIELEGQNPQIDSVAAYQRAYYHHTHRGESVDWTPTAEFNTNGLSVDGEAGTNTVTHVTVRNCEIHDFPGGGLGASYCDYITFENNLIYNNAWYTMYACSGISIINPVNSDAKTDHKLIVRGNICNNNMTKIPWFRSDIEGYFQYSDGNGIIIDINNKNYEGGPYNGRTLVQNNLSFDNGGSGIHAYSADHVDIINNTAYFNGKRYADGEYGDIYAHGCEDVHLVNNIMYARPGGHCNKAGKENSIVYENNLCFNGTVFDDESYFIDGQIADPMFVNPTVDRTTADFHLKAGSPAIGMGVSKPYSPQTDIEGTPRSGSIDVGAYCYK